ncbi:MAG: AAA family ATPase, partial [Planctomycetota bacterium]|nr:AAA family ATPase [Planctomycetota bacterium]
MARLVVVEGEMKGTLFRLLDEGAVVGRSVSANIRLNDTEVSRQHSKVVKEGDAYYIEDMGSRNGTIVNGERIEGRRLLKDGDRIRVGKTLLEFQAIPTVSEEESKKSTVDVPPPDEKRAKAQTVVSVSQKSGEPFQEEVKLLERMRNAKDALLREIRKVIIGQEEVVEQVMTALFARGHCLIVGVPGLAKTLIVRTIAGVLDLDFKRIQFTPDLMPSDITGTDVLQDDPVTKERSFRFIKGPIFTNVLLADEINRTPPKTQAALLEAMQEYRVTASGYTYNLPLPFFVLATQNPIEQEGTYPLPEAQLDRFMFMVNITYPDRDEEMRIVKETTGEVPTEIEP